MKKFLLFALLTSLFSLHAHADWDAAAEAREDAKRKAAQQQEARKKAEVDKMLREANVKAIADVGFDYVGISLDGLKDTHDRFRRKEGAFEAALNGIRLCRAQRLRYDNNDMAGLEARLQEAAGARHRLIAADV